MLAFADQLLYQTLPFVQREYYGHNYPYDSTFIPVFVSPGIIIMSDKGIQISNKVYDAHAAGSLQQ